MRHRLRSCLAVALVLAGCTAAGWSQGCSLCRDNTGATPPATQLAYRHAIVLLGTVASSIFVGTVVLLRRMR
ncbi:MAG: copper resistance protein CopC [Acidobacteriota bacterium]|nr:copper resistance protein CopC [Acidobacteriota bacterium]